MAGIEGFENEPQNTEANASFGPWASLIVDQLHDEEEEEEREDIMQIESSINRRSASVET